MQLPKFVEQFPVVASLFHLVACAVFLTGYATGFGAGVGGLFGLSDLFSLSLSDLSLVYFSGLLVPILAVAPQFRPGYISPAERLLNSGDPADRDHLMFLRRFHGWQVGVVFAVALLLIVPTTFFAWRLDLWFPFALMSMPATLAVTLGWMKFARKLPTSHQADLIIALGLSIMSGALIAGLMRGQSERRDPFSSFNDHRMKCAEMVIMRPAGSRFIAVDPAGQRSVINEECKVLFTIPKRPPFENVTLPEAAARWWRSLDL